MSTTGTPCAACGSDLVPGAPFCAACGASARRTAALPAAPHVPELGDVPPVEAAVVPTPRVPAPVVPVPVLVPVTPLPLSAPDLRRAPAPAASAPHRAAGSAGLGDPVPGIAPRLLALLVDQAVAGVAAGLVLLVMSLLAGSATSAGAADAVTISLLMSTFLLPGLVATVVQVAQWTWEGRTGKTVGNLVLHLRTVSAATGRAAGFWAIVVRQLLQGLGALVCYVGAYVVAASGAWDSGPRRQGWHDKVAGTVVVSAPRAAPMDRAGAGASAAPAPPMPWGSEPQFSPNRLPAPAPLPAPALSAPALSAPALLSTPPGIISAVPGFAAHPVVAPPAPAPRPVVVLAPTPFVTEPPMQTPPAVRFREPAPARASAPAPVVPAPSVPAPDDVDETRLSSGAASEVSRFDLVFDTGEVVHVAGDGVVGRNPAPAPGESVTHRVCIPDRERSVSKTHLGFGLDVGGLWVADLGSTNGSVLIDADGVHTALGAGVRAHVTRGSVVQIGDHSFRVETP